MEGKKLSFLIENQFCTVNRVLNLFCGKGFVCHSLNVVSLFEENKSELTLEISGDIQILDILIKKILNFVDVYQLNNKPHHQL